MCGGGGGGGSSAAEIDALNRQREAERQARIRATIDQINQIMLDPSREQEYQQLREAVYQRNMEELQRRQQEAERQLRNQLARAGLAGGTADVRVFDTLKKNYDDTLMQLQKFADQAANKFRNADDQSRLQLISQAQAGLDATTAAQNAQNALRLNQSLMSSQNELMPLGNLLAGITLAGQQQAAQQGQQAAQQAYLNNDQWNTWFQRPTKGGYQGTEVPY